MHFVHYAVLTLFALSSGCSTLHSFGLVAAPPAISVHQVIRESGMTPLTEAMATCENSTSVSVKFDSWDAEKRKDEFASELSRVKAAGWTHVLVKTSDSYYVNAYAYKGCSKYADRSRDELSSICLSSLKVGKDEGCADYAGTLDPKTDDALSFVPIAMRVCKTKNYFYCEKIPEAEEVVSQIRVREAKIAEFNYAQQSCIKQNSLSNCLKAASMAELDGSYELADQIASKGCSLGSMPACTLKATVVEKMRLKQDRELAQETFHHQRILADQQMANDREIAARNRAAAFWNAYMISNSQSRSNCVSQYNAYGQVVTRCNNY